MQRFLKLTKQYGEGLFILILGLFSIVMFYHSFSIKRLSSASDAAGPGFMPKVIFGAMMILAVLLAADYTIRMRGAAKKEKIGGGSAVRGLISIGGVFIFIFLMDKIGFFLSSILYLYFEIWFLGPEEKRRPLAWAAISVLFCIAVYYLFRYRVYVQLPKGILG